MKISTKQIRSYRLHVHHLDRKIPMEEMTAAAGVCGLQNTPPGAWETALFHRLDSCTLQALNDALYRDKTLLQAWSWRGVPVVFPTARSDVFLTPLIAQEGEDPWIYTRGITGALDHLQLPFDDLLSRTKEALKYLDSHTITSKEALDQTLADLIRDGLPEGKRALWCDPSMYGNPERQTVGGAAVSFLLRPCSFHSLVVFGERQGVSPTFTSFKSWTGRAPVSVPHADKVLMRKFLHCYGPSTVDCLMNWLGCSPRQARRLWSLVAEEITPVQVDGKACYMLSADLDSLRSAESNDKTLLLLGAHDPYLDMRDRDVILENKALHKTVWKFAANPGVVLKGGRIIGIWNAKTRKDQLNVSIRLWEAVTSAEEQALKQLAEEYAAFRLVQLQSCTIDVD